MSRYIDADALYKALEKIYYCEMYSGEMRDSSILITFRTVCRQIDSIPTADVVKVVRCKDCKFYQDNNGGYPNQECKWIDGETPNADDFCSFAERRTE